MLSTGDRTVEHSKSPLFSPASLSFRQRAYLASISADRQHAGGSEHGFAETRAAQSLKRAYLD